MKYYTLVLLMAASTVASWAQELEPRALTNLPLKTNFMVAGYSYVYGNMLFDPSLPLEDVNTNLHTIIVAYARSIKLFGLSGKIDAVVPYGIGDWEGIYTGIDTTTARTGFADIRLRVSVNFLGAPPLKKEEFSSYRPRHISGVSFQLIAPTGQYDPARLINLGSNRWVIKAQWGYALNTTNWIFETYISGWFFTKNNDFFGGNTLQLKPLGTIKLHTIRKLPKRMWTAFNIGYAVGGRGYVNDEARESRISTLRLGLTYAVPVATQHTLRVVAMSGIPFEQGPDFTSFSFFYQYRW